MVVGLFVGLFSLAIANNGAAISRTEDIELTIPDTVLEISGYAAPGALVTIQEGSSTLGTVLANAEGAYSTVLTSQDAGLRSIKTYFTDAEGIRSQTSTRNISIQPQRVTSFETYLSPTIIRRTPTQVQSGSIVQIVGYTVADARVSLSFGVVGDEQQVIANSAGYYEFLLDTKILDDGKYTVSTSSKKTGLTDSSEQSKSVSFRVVSKEKSEEGAPDIIVRPNQLPPPIPQSPDDGSVIVGDSVLITGESVPYAQIVIYENGKVIGSVLSNGQGKWEFNYTATSSPIVLTFEACREGVCSVLSQSLSLSFPALVSTQNPCSKQVFELESYRFWGVLPNEEVMLDVLLTNGDGVLFVDWGDGTTEERFDHDADRPTSYEHVYSTGQHNGSIRFEQGECNIARYFSVDARGHSGINTNFYLMALLILAILPFSYWSYIEGKVLMQKEVKKATKSNI